MGQLLNNYELTNGTASCSEQVSGLGFLFWVFFEWHAIKYPVDGICLPDFIQNEIIFLTGLFSLLPFHKVCRNYITQAIKEIPTNLSINTSVYKVAAEWFVSLQFRSQSQIFITVR